MRIKRRALDIRSERGFTIIEVMIAITIFGLVMTFATIGLGTALSLTRNNRSRSVAANLASQENDIVRTTLFSALPLGQIITTQLVDTTTYTITRNSEWVSTTATTSECLAGVAATVAYLRVSIAVTWPNMKGTAPVTSQSLVTPPIGTYSTNSGNVGVTVRDRSAAPQESIPVTLTGPGVSLTQFTGSDGCAFFPFQPAGVYTVSLLLFGFVNGQEQANPSQTVTIVTGSTVSASFDFDQASTLVLTMTGAAGGVPPNLLKASLGNTGLVPSGFVSVPGAVGVVRTVTGLYPYSSGYKPWAGDCLDADPEALKADGTGPYYPGATRDAPLNSSPGGTTTGILTLSTVRVQVNAFAGPAVVGATVTAVHGIDNRCPIGETFTLPGVTDATGSLTSALPFGTWTFKVTGRLPKTVWPAPILAPPAPGVATVVAVVVQ